MVSGAPQILFQQVAQRVIVPTAARLSARARVALGGTVALNLVLGTAAQESGLSFIAQWPVGPGSGPYQTEPATHDDLRVNFLKFRPDLGAALDAELVPERNPLDQLYDNWAYATAVCRLIYFRAHEPLPPTPDPELLGAYWKAHYNTGGGKGSADEFVRNFELHIGKPLNG